MSCGCVEDEHARPYEALHDRRDVFGVLVICVPLGIMFLDWLF